MIERESDQNPFPGLRPFELEEHYLFFGREGQSEELIGRLRRNRLLAVVGTSGSGKSSLVRAGLLPLLYGGFMAQAGSGWHIAVTRPGDSPVRNLARVLNQLGLFELAGAADGDGAAGAAAAGLAPAPLPDAASSLKAALVEAILRRSALGLIDFARQSKIGEGGNLLVVVDQFEELFRFKGAAAGSGTGDEAAAFVKLLLEAARQRELPIYVVITMRSDFLGDCAQFRDLPEAINDGQYLIPRMTRDQQREAITCPPAVYDVQMTPRLVQRLLTDVGDNPDQLPILQHALMRTWDCWKARADDSAPIDLEHYNEVGGMAAALSKHADEAYAELPDDDARMIAEKLFKALTETVQDNREVRRPARLREVCDILGAEPERVIEVVEIFRAEGRSFIMPPPATPLAPDTLLDISHESLIRNWTKLKAWAEEEAQAAQVYRRLDDAARRQAQRRGSLWRDLDLSAALKWEADQKPNAAWALRYAQAVEGDDKLPEAERERLHREEFDRAMNFLRLSEKTYADEQDEERREQEEKLERERALALAMQQRAEEQQRAAEAESRRAEADRGREQEARLRAEEQQRAAEANAEVERQRAEAERERAEAQHLLAKQRAKTTRRLSLALALCFIMAVVAAGFAVYAFQQRASALRSAAEAERQGLVAVLSSINATTQQEIAVAAAAQVEDTNRLLEGQRDRAEGNEKEAKRQKEIAQAKAAEADRERARAMESEAEAIRQRDIAKRSFDELQKSNKRENQQTYELGRQEVLAGNPLRALIYLNKVFPANDNLATRLLLRQATRPVEAAAATLAKGGHENRVISAAFAPAGDRVLTSSEDNTARLWDRDGSLISVLGGKDGHTGRVNAAAFSPNDGEYIVTASTDFTVKVWDRRGNYLGDLTRQEGESTMRAHHGPVYAVAFSPDGQRVITVGADKAGRVWDVKERKLLFPLAGHLKPEGHRAAVRHVTFDESGRRILTASQDGSVKLWKADDGTLTDTLSPSRRTAYGFVPRALHADFDPRSPDIAVAYSDYVVTVWRRDDAGRYNAVELPTRHKDEVTFVGYSRGGHIITASKDETANVYDAESRQFLFTLSGHASDVVSADFNRDNTRIVTASRDGTAKVWDAFSGKLLLTLAGHTDGLFSASFSRVGNRVVTASGDYTGKIWEVGSTLLLKRHTGHKNALNSAVFAPDDRRVLSADKDRFQIWDAVSGDLLVNEKIEGTPPTQITHAALSEEGNRLLTVEAVLGDRQTGPGVVIRNGTTGAVISRLGAEGDNSRPQTAISATFDHAGERVVTAHSDYWARIYRVSGNQPPLVLQGKGQHKAQVNYASFSRDGKRVVTASNDETAKVWDAASGELLQSLEGPEGHRSDVYAASFSPDDKLIVTAGGDRTAKVWDATTYKPRFTLNGHQGRVYFAAFSPDSKLIVTASGDGTAKIWDAAGGELLLTLEGHRREVLRASFSRDGQRVVTASNDGTAVVWDVDIERRGPGDIQRLADLLPFRLNEEGRLVKTTPAPTPLPPNPAP